LAGACVVVSGNNLRLGPWGAGGRPHPQRLLALCLPLLLSACAAVSTASPSGSDPHPSGSASSTALEFLFEGDEPTVTRELTGIDESFINPGAVIEQAGTLHMFANVFTAWPGPVSVPHLTSTDGVTWTLAEPNPVLTERDIPIANPSFDVSSGYVADDGTWVLIFETVSTAEPWVLGRATAPGPDGPWNVDPEPILEPGPEGSIDAGGLAWPSVVHTETGYFMYYTALDGPAGTGVIAVATSPDGQSWEKRPEAVLTADLPWELGKLDRPRAAVTPDGMVMLYSGLQLTDRGMAVSQDGIAWQKSGDAPVINRETFPVTGGAWDAALIHRGGELIYYLEVGGGTPSTGTQVYRAVAEL
jgi:predicted GH43/DUF377 family glycosyl hydrolase